MIHCGKVAAGMQILVSYLGVDGARYASFVLAAAGLLIAILVVWWLIRKAMGDRLNMGDKADRRGRPPRLGITESFTVDRQGRRLVMVRRDNVEHLVMIGGPNDVVIETNVIRGERPAVGRADLRTAEPELLIPPAPIEITPAKPIPAPIIKPLEPVKAALMPAPVVEIPKSPSVEPPVPPPAAKPSLSLAERLKSVLPMGGAAVEAAKPLEVSKPAEVMKAVEPVTISTPAIAESAKAELAKVLPAKAMAPQPEQPKLALRIELPKVELPIIEPSKLEIAKLESAKPMPAKLSMAEELKATIEGALKTPAQPVAAPLIIAAPAVLPPAAPPVAPPPAPLPVAPAAPALAKVASKNPFDSLEEEMAKLLGRTPDGKG